MRQKPVLTLLALASLSAAFANTCAASVLDPWIGTWGVSPEVYSGGETPGGKTLRQIVHTSAGGSAVRITVSNLYGTTPLTLGNVHVAVSTGLASVDASTDRALFFNGQPSITLAPGQSTTSDGADFVVPAVSNLAVSFYVPQAPSTITGHGFSAQDRYVADGNVSGEATLNARAMGDYEFLTGVDVQSATGRGAVVTLGASITDGYGSGYNANHRWPNRLADRLHDAGLEVGVINEGISGNNLFDDGESPLLRFDRDVLGQAGVRWVIFSDDPLNDLANGHADATVPQLVTAYRSLIDRAHAAGIRFACSTLTPWQGSDRWTAAREAVRQDLNAWIKGSDSACDAVVDQDALTHDPEHPEAFLPAYDSGDHLHPNDAGYAAIAQAVDLALFTPVTLSPVTPPTGCAAFQPGNGLKPQDMLRSCDGRFTLILQGDGNVVLYKEPGQPLWASGTVNRDAAQLELTTSGDFVLYGRLGEQLWRSGHAGQTAAQAFLQTDGNLVIYGPNSPVWASNTSQP
ncbi:SGNH/GDSL hydrolase family protein [Luteibacter sp. 329MFSha]|uniref:GDSL-type esterase/lipase family protein n=1 Tax=Luteibacter sp. 329MFSha TaxID=1798239 RepID=UPI0008CAA6B3|nr:SGNH/GDSL hydrolase family protein [Luteibacter sp. 329MFSha]SEV89637.1 Lysophospholipase L1 [Luteibacter sp. 329MFSha]